MADVKMPQLGEAVTEGTIIRWLKSEGDFVTQDEPLFEVSTDKVDSEVPSPASGIIEKIIFPEGATVDVGMTLAVIGQQGSQGEEKPLSTSNLTSLASMRDLASITASMGVAAHIDQVSMVPEPEIIPEPEMAPESQVAPDSNGFEYGGQDMASPPPFADAAQNSPFPADTSFADFYPGIDSEFSPPLPMTENVSEPFLPSDFIEDVPKEEARTTPAVDSPDSIYIKEEAVSGGENTAFPDKKMLTEWYNKVRSGIDSASADQESVVYSPVVRRLAEDNNIDISTLVGTGPGGRITREDVLKQLEEQNPSQVVQIPLKEESSAKEQSIQSAPGDLPTARGDEASDVEDFLTAEEIAAERLNVQPVETNVATGQDQLGVSQSAETASILGKLWNSVNDTQPEPEVESARYKKERELSRPGSNWSETDDERIPFTAMRRITAEHMSKSKAVSPHSFVIREVDFEQVEQLRQIINRPTSNLFDFHVTYLPFVLSALIDTLPKYKKINSSVGRDELIIHRKINIGIVVDLEGDGMIVPVLHAADKYGLNELVNETRKLVTKARSRSLGAEDITGGTISVSNQGVMGAALTFPIITQPQVAILSIEEIKRKPTVVSVGGEEAIAVHSIGMLGLAFDARVIDASYAAAFLRDLGSLIETKDFSKELGLT